MKKDSSSGHIKNSAWGINYFDTSPVYSDSEETHTGKAGKNRTTAIRSGPKGGPDPPDSCL